jgi:hypothetical protein
MKKTKPAEAERKPQSDTFAKRYERNERGFYVSVAKPPSAKLNEKRIEGNVRSLLEKSVSRESASSRE